MNITIEQAIEVMQKRKDEFEALIKMSEKAQLNPGKSIVTGYEACDMAIKALQMQALTDRAIEPGPPPPEAKLVYTYFVSYEWKDKRGEGTACKVIAMDGLIEGVEDVIKLRDRIMSRRYENVVILNFILLSVKTAEGDTGGKKT